MDLNNPRYGDLLKKYLKTNCSGDTRVKIARFIEWLTIGAGVSGCMHGGGSPDEARMMINAKSDLDRFISLAKNLINLDEDSSLRKRKNKRGG
jgi:4-hydroxybutyryl-CoA dehydratase / vinylacetyl-CoA-Delta-isomerase